MLDTATRKRIETAIAKITFKDYSYGESITLKRLGSVFDTLMKDEDDDPTSGWNAKRKLKKLSDILHEADAAMTYNLDLEVANKKIEEARKLLEEIRTK